MAVTTKVEPTEVQSGSNYVIYPNGLKMCWGRTLVKADTQATSSASITPWYGSQNITFPIVFNSTPSCFATVHDWAHYWVATFHTPTKTGGQLRIGGDSNDEKYISWLAIGY